MRQWWKPFLIAGLISLIHAAPAAAGFVEDRKTCDTDSPIEARISACSRLIASGRVKGGDLAVTYNNRAFAWQISKDFSRATDDFDTAIKVMPGLEPPWFGRARLWAERGEHQRAIADFDRAIALNPKLTRTYVSRGESWAALGDNQRALADFEQTIRMEPGNHPYAYHARGAIFRRIGNFDAAIASHDQGLRIDPVQVYGLVSRAYALSEKGQQDRALSDADEALRLNPNSAYAYMVRGLIFNRKSNPDRAIADLDQAIRRSPNDARSYAWRGLAHEMTGDNYRAWSDFDAALKVTEGRRDDREQAQATARERVRAIETARVQQPPTTVAVAPAAAPIPASIVSAPIGSAASSQGRRVALVIGNSDYRAVPALPNPRHDATAIADALRRTGFQSVTLATDLTREKLVDTLRRFAAESDSADWSLIYFAGHGIEVGGQNYVIPIDAKLSADRDVQYEAVPMDQLMSATGGAKKLRLLLLDACRENPFANQMKRVVASRSLERGLTQVETDAGTLVVFAAKHGQVAFDGQGGNSPFVSALVQRMLTPQLEIRKMFDLVRDDVMAATGRRQQPFSYGSVPGNEDFYFMRSAVAAR
jgi:tetratricopeptide (TPR) repeat protein